MDLTIGQILHIPLLDKNQEHWADYVTIGELVANSIINASI